MPIVTFLGHAGIAVTADRFRLLADPWLAPTGGFLASWHQYPRNDHLDVTDLAKADWVAVSHEHLDHFDPWFLGQLSPKTRVLIPKYPGPAFRERVIATGIREVIEVPPWEKFPLDNHGSWITSIPEISPMCHDSAFLIVADGHAVLHCNDARLTTAQARRAKHLAGGRLDLMAVQTSGASWHPICYDYPPAEISRIACEKKIAKLHAVRRLIRGTAPELAVPFAGPPCFLDDEVRKFNHVLLPDGAFCDPEQSAAWLSSQLPSQKWAHFKPGDTVDLSSGTLERDPVSAKHSYTEGLDRYLDEYAADRAERITAVHAAYPLPGPGLGERVTAYFGRLGSLSSYFNEQIGMTVRFDVTGPNGGVWDVEFAASGATVSEAGDAPMPTPGYWIRIAGRWLDAVLAGRIAWEDVLISLRVALGRDPDLYNDYLVGLLKHANGPALAAVEEYETGRDESERIVVRSNGHRYEIPRYCPHAGEDLSIGAVVRNGQLHCLGHNFAFDLATGNCVNARCQPLTTRLLNNVKQPN